MRPVRDTHSGSDRADTSPFFLAGGKHGCLLVHGLGGTPYEMRALGERLHASGFTVCGVRLAGHATQVEDLAGTGREDWLRSAEQGLEELGAHCTAIATIGLSAGALICSLLAHRHPEEVTELVLLAPAFELSRWWLPPVATVAGLLHSWVPESWRYFPRGASDIADATARELQPGYDFWPWRSLAELMALRAESRAVLGEIRQPTFVIQGRQDHTVPLRTLALLQQELPNLWGTAILPASYHVITVDRERRRVAEEVLRFLEQVERSRRSFRPRRRKKQ